MQRRRQWFPHIALSLSMWVLWLLLMNDLSGGHVVLGGILAWAIPWFTQSFWPEEMTVRKPLVSLKFVLTVLWDIVIANLTVARLILSPTGGLKPAFMVLPLDVKEDFTITMLANTISMTPGTVSTDLSADRRTLLIHSLHVDDIDAALTAIKQRYEAPLKEIFECSHR